MAMSRVIHKKVWPEYFEQILSGKKKFLVFLCFLPELLCGMQKELCSASGAGPSGDVPYALLTTVSVRSETISDRDLWGLVYHSAEEKNDVSRCAKLMGVPGFIRMSDLPEALDQAVRENDSVLVLKILNYASVLSAKDISSALIMAMYMKRVKVVQIFLRNKTILSMHGVDALLKIAVDYDIKEAVHILLSNASNPVSFRACKAAVRVARLHKCVEIQRALVNYAARMSRAQECCNVM